MSRLDLRLVEYFVAVAEELHFGRAAERLHIAQPSLSQQIRQLERQLGVTLFERTSRRVELTGAGEALLREGRRTLYQARRAVQATREAGREHLVVGFYGSAGGALLTDVLGAFVHDQPSIDVSVRELGLGTLDDLIEGSVDIAFTRLLPAQTVLEIDVLSHEPRLAALSSTHPLAGRETIEFADIREEAFITNPIVQSSGPPPRWLAEQRRHGLPGRVASEATSVQEILTLVAAGRGVCLVPRQVARDNPRTQVSYVEVTDADPAVVSLAWSRENHRPATAAFRATALRVAAVAGGTSQRSAGGCAGASQSMG